MRRRLVLAVALLVCALVGPSAASSATSASSALYFSEYVEGSSNNKALELFNDTGGPVDLAAGSYNVQMFFNGNPASTLTINLTGTVADGDVFVLAQSSADPAILAAADQTNGSGWFNGRRRRRAAQGDDRARRDRPDRHRPGHRVGVGAHEHGRQHAAPQGVGDRRRHERQ
jgi:predicted extracellular nuclease